MTLRRLLVPLILLASLARGQTAPAIIARYGVSGVQGYDPASGQLVDRWLLFVRLEGGVSVRFGAGSANDVYWFHPSPSQATTTHLLVVDSFGGSTAVPVGGATYDVIDIPIRVVGSCQCPTGTTVNTNLRAVRSVPAVLEQPVNTGKCEFVYDQAQLRWILASGATPSGPVTITLGTGSSRILQVSEPAAAPNATLPGFIFFGAGPEYPGIDLFGAPFYLANSIIVSASVTLTGTNVSSIGAPAMVGFSYYSQGLFLDSAAPLALRTTALFPL